MNKELQEIENLKNEIYEAVDNGIDCYMGGEIIDDMRNKIKENLQFIFWELEMEILNK